MGYTVKVNHPHFPEGTVFNVGGLDRVPNGDSLEVDDEMERLFIMQQGQTLEDAFADDHMVEVSGSSALDNDERNSLLEAYGPQPEPEELINEGESLVDENANKNQEQPAWLVPKEQEGGDDDA